MDTHNQRSMRTDSQLSADDILAANTLATDWTEQEVLNFIANCFDRDVLLKILLGYASQWLSTRMIAVVTKTGLQPFMLEGWPDSYTELQDTARLRTLRAPFQPLPQNPQTPENLLTLTPIQNSGLQSIFYVLKLPAPPFLAVQAIQVATKTALLLIGTPQQPSTVEIQPELDINALNNAAVALGKQLEEIINRHKSNTLPPVDERVPPLPRPIKPTPSAVIVEELTNELLTHKESSSSLIDDGWLDLLEDPKNAATPRAADLETESEPQIPPALRSESDAFADTESIANIETAGTDSLDNIDTEDRTSDDEIFSPQPQLHRAGHTSERPALTLEMFPDALLGLNNPRATVTHGFENLSDDSLAESIATPAPEPEQKQDQDQELQSPEPEQEPETLQIYVAGRTLSGGFEAVSREPETTYPVGQTHPGGFDAVLEDPKNRKEPETRHAPDARVLRRMSITPRSFSELNTPEPEPEPSAQTTQPAEPAYDLQALKKAFPGHLVIDRYQHTIQTMPPAREHGPLLAEIADIGLPALEIIREFINTSSLELRFYATLLLTEIPGHNLLEDVVERLFDRDQQIRGLAQTIILNARLDTGFERIVLQRLRHEIISNIEDVRVEISAETIGNLRDTHAIPLLIDALAQHRPRVQLAVQNALRLLTFQDLAPSISEWRRWWQTAQTQSPTTWLVDALDSPNPDIRHHAFAETQKIPGLSLNYHPDQPQKLRARAQTELHRWFQDF